MKDFISFFACLSLSLIAANTEASITINASSFHAEITYPSLGGFGGGMQIEDSNFYGTTIPTSTTVNLGDQDRHNNNTINWFVSSGQTVLSFDTDQKRLGTAYSSSAQTTLDPLTFTANSNEPYVLSGYYNVTDVGAAGYVLLFVLLEDQTTSTFEFFHRQYSANTINEQFVVGGTGGDFLNQLLGSLTGNLIAGHDYRLRYESTIQAYPDDDLGASALGNITLKIGAVPEPSTFFLLGIGAISLLGYGRGNLANTPMPGA